MILSSGHNVTPTFLVIEQIHLSCIDTFATQIAQTLLGWCSLQNAGILTQGRDAKKHPWNAVRLDMRFATNIHWLPL